MIGVFFKHFKTNSYNLEEMKLKDTPKVALFFALVIEKADILK